VLCGDGVDSTVEVVDSNKKDVDETGGASSYNFTSSSKVKRRFLVVIRRGDAGGVEHGVVVIDKEGDVSVDEGTQREGV